MALMSTMIMEGASYGGKLDHSYDHENGSGLIAMESAEALRDIFEASFYSPETCAIQAALEGASCVEESTQAAIMEAALNSAFEKIKQFFINLKDKVKEFLHNIKRYLTGIFSNDEKWVKTYEKELKAIPSADLKDYKVKMYNYNIMAALDKAGLEDKATKLKEGVDQAIDSYVQTTTDKNKNNRPKAGEDFTDRLNEIAEKQYLDFIKTLVGDKSIDEDELDKELWSMMRGGAETETDKEDVAVSGNINSFIETLKKSSKDISAYDNMISKTESMYQKSIKFVTDLQKKYENAAVRGGTGIDKDNVTVNGHTTGAGGRQYMIEGLRKYSSTLSKMQTADNKKNNAAKSALVERNAAYKSALTGAFAYARKHKGGK